MNADSLFPARVRKIPVEVEGLCWQPNETLAAAKMFDWLDAHDAKWHVGEDSSILVIETLEGLMQAAPGSWVIRGVRGEFYPVKADIFDATYEFVTTFEEYVGAE